MWALIWLDSHYIVALNNPNVIKLKACLMVSTQGGIFGLYMLKKYTRSLLASSSMRGPNLPHDVTEPGPCLLTPVKPQIIISVQIVCSYLNK